MMYLGQGYKPISIKSLLKVNNQSNKKGATYAPVPSAEEFASEIGLTALENVLQVNNFVVQPFVLLGLLAFLRMYYCTVLACNYNNRPCVLVIIVHQKQNTKYINGSTTQCLPNVCPMSAKCPPNVSNAHA